jgi:hypothetical protein
MLHRGFRLVPGHARFEFSRLRRMARSPTQAGQPAHTYHEGSAPGFPGGIRNDHGTVFPDPLPAHPRCIRGRAALARAAGGERSIVPVANPRRPRINRARKDRTS